ncbi:hypothetical protein PTSG_13271 [Salpingoeca rosetta]|uniref:Uncharacterized protein n=1 Tax=Salpingoeca rosetta (strain ATCC 50818 / BSB-021) TaxID=946362 RepID=F2UTB9_SALR5|nr:uncharacterized protein PTSG_13271 [Salpingoeca rosetta]EGD82372.1 hypothetical protein PTSG_13271 [Salpingoeca rosetta]|eukprot:XP_004987584.1 hypothetical protein PTSG_13271 [Salpingoeca rosetta]
MAVPNPTRCVYVYDVPTTAAPIPLHHQLYASWDGASQAARDHVFGQAEGAGLTPTPVSMPHGFSLRTQLTNSQFPNASARPQPFPFNVHARFDPQHISGQLFWGTEAAAVTFHGTEQKPKHRKKDKKKRSKKKTVKWCRTEDGAHIQASGAKVLLFFALTGNMSKAVYSAMYRWNVQYPNNRWESSSCTGSYVLQQMPRGATTREISDGTLRSLRDEGCYGRGGYLGFLNVQNYQQCP